MLQEFNPTSLYGDNLMELGMGELKMVFKKSKRDVYLLLPMGRLSSCYVSLQCNSRQEDLRFLVRDRNKIK